MYDYQTLTLTNIDGSISPFSNGDSGLILLGTGTSTPPAWTSFADAGIATKQYVDDTFLPLTGGTCTGAVTFNDGITLKTTSGTTVTPTSGILQANSSGVVSVVSTTNANGKFLKCTITNNVASYSFEDISTSLPAITSLASGENHAGYVLITDSAPNYSPTWTPYLSVSQGGTGTNTLPENCILLGNGANAVGSIAIPQGSTNNTGFLRYDGTTYGWYPEADVTANYLPLSGGVMGYYGGSLHPAANAQMTSFNPISTDLIENRGRYYGVCFGNTSSSTYIVINTNISANTALVSSQTFLQIHVTGLDIGTGSSSNTANTIDFSIGLSIKTSTATNDGITSNLDLSKSGWSTSGSCAVTALSYGVDSNNKYVFVATVATSSSYRVNVDVFCDNLAVRGPNFIEQIRELGSYPNGCLLNWLIASSNSVTVKALTQSIIPVSSHTHTITGLDSGSTYPNKVLMVGAASSYTPTWNYIKDIPTGLSTAGIAQIDSNGKLTSSPTVSLATEVTGTLLVANGGTGAATLSGVLLGNGTNPITGLNPTLSTTPLILGGLSGSGNGLKFYDKKSLDIGTEYSVALSISQSTASADNWIRIAVNHDKYSEAIERYNIGLFRVYGYSSARRAACEFFAGLINGANPTINQLSFNIESDKSIDKARIVYKSASDTYLEIHLKEIVASGNRVLNAAVSCFSGWKLYTEATPGNTESANGYTVYEYEFYDDVGSNGQVLSSVNTTSTDSTTGQVTNTVSRAWTSLATPPSAPTNTPLADSETGAIGAAGSYATETHQHPYPSTISGTLEIAKGGTGATTAAAAIAALGGVKKSGDEMTGGLTFGSSVSVPITWTGHSGAAVFNSSGELTPLNNLNAFVTGRRQNINLYDADISSSINSPTDLSNTINAGNDTVINIVCGQSAIANYTRYFKIPTPTVNRLGDTLTVYFTNQNPTKIGTLWAMCETDNRITDLNYANFSNAGSSGFKVCKWSSGNVLQFTCIRKGASGDYFWRAVKYSESSDWPES